MSPFRALSHPHKVSPATRAAVQAAIERLGYVPNLTAGSLASRRSKIVGAIVPTLSNSWFADAMDGLAETLGAAGYQLMLGQSRYHPQEEAGLVDAFIGRKVDALVLTGVVHQPSVRSKLRRLQLPTVEIWDLTDDPIDMVVGFSNQGIGEAVADYLLARGHRQVGFIGADEVRSLKRLQGLRSRLQTRGLEVTEAELVQPPSTIEDGARGLACIDGAQSRTASRVLQQRHPGRGSLVRMPPPRIAGAGADGRGRLLRSRHCRRLRANPDHSAGAVA
ncbi:LacI family DNA-binding transcriptional regulator [Polaromonas sp. P2-4]|nr:LacI family DNA-binding transcriptional regulator [Polaromonas sp. P2-4]